MSETTQDRWGAASGLAALAVVAAAMVFERGAPPAGAPDTAVAAFHAAHSHALLTQSLLFLVSAALLLWFLGCLRARLAAAEGGTGRYAGIGFGAGVAYVALSVVSQAGQIALARVAATAAAPQLVAAVAALAWALFTVAAVPAAVMLAAFAVLALRSGALPAWLGWLAAVAGAAQLGLLAALVVDTGPLSPGGWYTFAPYPLYVIWLAATAVTMLRRPARPPAARTPGRGGTPMTSAPGLSRVERLTLHVEHVGNKRLRRLATALFRRAGGRIRPGGHDILLLTTYGRRSGREHTVLLQYFPDRDGMTVVAANSGRTALPDWYLNLMSGPQATVEIRGRASRVRPVELTTDEADAVWPRILHRAPTYGRYRRAAGRVIPLVRLVTAESPTPSRGDPTTRCSWRPRHRPSSTSPGRTPSGSTSRSPTCSSPWSPEEIRGRCCGHRCTSVRVGEASRSRW